MIAAIPFLCVAFLASLGAGKAIGRRNWLDALGWAALSVLCSCLAGLMVHLTESGR